MNGKRFTPEEDAILEKHFCTIPHKKLTELLPGRPHQSVMNRGRYMFPNRFRPTTENFIRRCPDCDAVLTQQPWDHAWVCPGDGCPVIRVSYGNSNYSTRPEINKVIYEAIGLNRENGDN